MGIEDLLKENNQILKKILEKLNCGEIQPNSQIANEVVETLSNFADLPDANSGIIPDFDDDEEEEVQIKVVSLGKANNKREQVENEEEDEEEDEDEDEDDLEISVKKVKKVKKAPKKVQKAISNKDIKRFVEFPFKLYKNSKYWVPPIISEEINIFNSDINPALKISTFSLYLAIKDNVVVGRIAAIINSIEVNEKKIKKIRFGWFDVIDDLNVTKKLIEKVNEIGKENNLEYMEGPIGFSNLDKVGVLTHGFDKIGTMITWYNHPYYSSHFKKLNFKVEKQYVEKQFSFKK